MNSINFSDKSNIFSFSTKNQFTQFSIISSGQPDFVEITGILQTIASKITIQNHSLLLGNINKSLLLYSFTIFSQNIFHLNFIYFSRLCFLTNFLYLFSSYQYQIK